MKQLTNIAVNNVKANKSKSILIIVAIVLTTLLLSSVGIITSHFAQNYKYDAIQNAGNAHAFFKKVDEKELAVIKNHREIEQYGVSSVIGTEEFGEIKTVIGYVDTSSFKMNNNILQSGKLPKKKNEVVIDKELLQQLGYPAKVGQKISVEYIDRETNQKVEEDFIVSGIRERNKSEQAYNSSSIYVSEAYFKEVIKIPSYSAAIRINGENQMSKDDIEFSINQIAAKMGIKEYDIVMNDGYLDYFKPDSSLFIGAFVIGSIVILTGVLVIYSIFYVAIVQRIQEFGKLRAIGATKKQIKKILLREGMLLSCIGIPIGMLLGWGVSEIILSQLDFASESVNKFTSTIILVAVLIVSLITVLLSILKPMKMASKVSPIEAIRYQAANREKQKTRKGHKNITLFNLMTTSLWRNKKRTYMTIISLSFSGILFMIMATILSGMNLDDFTRQSFYSDYKVEVEYELGVEQSYNEAQLNNPLTGNFIDQIEDLKGVKKIDKLKSGLVVYQNDKKLDLYGETGPTEFNLDGMPYKRLEELKDLLISGEINKQALVENNGIIIGHKALAENLQVKVGDQIQLTVLDGKRKYEETFTIQGILDSHQWLIVDNQLLNKLYKTNTNQTLEIFVDKKQEEAVGAAIKSISDQDNRLEYSTYKDAYKSTEFLYSTMRLVGLSLVSIIGLISFVNLINTMITSVITRKKELGVLQAIGMSNKQLLKMLQLEGIVYTICTLVSSLGLGSIGGYIAFLLLKESGASFTNVYSYPTGAAILLIVAVVIVQFILSFSVTKNFTKDSLVDRVRYSE